MDASKVSAALGINLPMEPSEWQPRVRILVERVEQRQKRRDENVLHFERGKVWGP
jgi:hypothetical protein